MQAPRNTIINLATNRQNRKPTYLQGLGKAYIYLHVGLNGLKEQGKQSDNLIN